MPRVKIKVKRRKGIFTLKSLGFIVVVLLLAGIVWFLNDTREATSAESVVRLHQKATPVRFPKDDGPHEVRTEWWYYNGHLKTQAGRRFSYHYTLFAHRAFAEHSIVHVSLLDHQTLKTHYFEKRIPGLVVKQDQDTWLLGSAPWQVALSKDKDTISGDTAEFALQLELDKGPVVLQEPDGILDFKEAGESYYYSRSRMPTRGTLTLDQVYQVEGQSWFDHQWGEFRATVMNWDWFALQLDNGADLMLYVLTDAAGAYVYSGGTYFKDGSTRFLTAEDFSAKPGAAWTSPATSYTYPVEWTLTVPSEQIELTLSAVKPDSEFNALKSTYSAYWEGPVNISGSHGGLGFVEVSKANSL